MSALTMTAPTEEIVTVPQKDLVITLKFFSTRNPLNQFQRTLKVTGSDEPLNAQAVLRLLDNEHSGHWIAKAHRAKWQRKQYGRMNEWRCFESKVEEVPAPEGDRPTKKTVDITDNEVFVEYDPFAKPKPVMGGWHDGPKLKAMGGTATFIATSQAHRLSSQPLVFSWSATGPAEHLEAMSPKGLMLDSVRANWDFGKFGPFDDYVPVSMTWDWARTDFATQKISLQN